MNYEKLTEAFLTDEILIKAISLRFSECFPAMNIANTFHLQAPGGTGDIPWKIVRTISPLDMIKEAKKRKIDLSSVKTSVGNTLIVESSLYGKVIKILHNQDENVAGDHYVDLIRCIHEFLALREKNSIDNSESQRLLNQIDFHVCHISDDEYEFVNNLIQKIQQKGDKMSVQEHKSRWGFHCCDYQTFRKIKSLHKWYYEALKEWADWLRWSRKEPQNRVVRKRIKDESGRTIGREVLFSRPEPLVCPFFHKDGKCRMFYLPLEMNIIDIYQNARRPRLSPEQVQPINEHQLQKLMKLYEDVSAWKENQKIR